MFFAVEQDRRLKYLWAGSDSIVISTPLGWSPLASELKSACDWGRINILICAPGDLLSTASDRHPIAWPGASRRHQSSAATSDRGRVIQIRAADKCSVHLQEKGSHRDASWLDSCCFFFSWLWRPENGKQQRHLLLLPQRKHNRKGCNSVQIGTFAWKTVSMSAPGVCVVVSARILHVQVEYSIPVPIPGTGTSASLCVSISRECCACAAQPKSCDQRGITWCTADKRREVGNWWELWKDMVGGCVQGRQQRGSHSCCSSLRGWHLANEWAPFNRKIDYLSHYSQEQVTRNYIIR